MIENSHKEENLTKLKSKHIKYFYININRKDAGKVNHTLIQLYQHLKEMKVDIIELTETNVHWKHLHDTSNFKKIIKDTWPEDKIGTCTL